MFSQLDGEKQLRKKAEGKCVGYESDVANLKKKLESSERHGNELLESVTHLKQLNNLYRISSCLQPNAVIYLDW